ncbi:sortase B protein-sorting domain-containing protein [Frisingicoccus sp.]|uniref:sortase B protein-sorting domain-containing protein n=1 Tax=Frisingicoccus sp. TaxID=1918627 RepID=UPI003AB8F818
MNKKKLVMATLLAITLTLSIVSTTVVYAQEETQSTNTESLADESEQSTYETVATESESIEPDIPEYAPSLTLASSTWTGQSDIVLDTQGKGGNVKPQEIYIYVESVSLGGIDVTPEMNLDSDGNGTIVFKNSDLQNATMFGPNGEAEVDWSKIDQIEISIGFELDGQYKSKFVYVPVDFTINTEPDTPEYTPSLTLASSTWTGQSDIVLDTQAKGGNVGGQENYIYVDNVSIGGIRITPEVNLDAEGNGTIVFKNSDLKNATMIGPYDDEAVDWSQINKIEILIEFELDGQYKVRTVFVPVDFVVSEPETETGSEIEPEPTEKVTITNESGIIMELPEGAPDHLELKVDVSTGADEKSAVQKVIQIAGDKIKTFDLYLLRNGEPYEYNGQFTSTVSLPVPADWNLNELALYYFNEDTKEVTPVLFSVDRENRMVIFATNHFSKYILVQKDVTRDDTTQKETTKAIDTPRTGDSSNVGLYASIFTISGIVILTLLRKKKGSENR